MLTIARMHSESVAYYESTVEQPPAQNLGPDAYYSEDGTRPAQAWIVARTDSQQAAVAEFLGTDTGAVVDGSTVQKWFNQAQAPSGKSLGRRPGSSGVPGFDLTLCAPKSVSLIWGLSASAATREAVDQAHARAVNVALVYLSEHAGYTRKASDWDPEEMVIDRVEALSGVKYEHRTSRAGDPHVHSHVLLSNRQLCADGKSRTVDSKSLYHEARAAGILYQAVLRSTLSETLGVKWAEVDNGCAEISGLDDRELLAEYSTRMREIDLWKAENGLESEAGLSRMGQKITRRAKDTETPLEELQQGWHQASTAAQVRAVIDGLVPATAMSSERNFGVVVPTPEAVLVAVTAERSTFTRADLVEKTAEMMPVDMDPARVHRVVEGLVDEVMDSGAAWSVNPDAARSYTKTAREGSQRFTAEPVVEEVNRGIDLATARVDQGVPATSIMPIEGKLSESQAQAMRAVVRSPYRASVVMAPAGAGKTSSLKAARRAWEQAGKTVVGLAPTGKAADVMVGEQVAHSSSTIARALVGTEDLSPAQIAVRLGWNSEMVLVVDEAGMVATSDVVKLLEVAAAAEARVVLVGDPHQYSAVKARSGMLATLSYELPDVVELDEVFRQKDPGERRASQWLRHGGETDATRAADWYAHNGRLHAGSTSAMLNDALAAWIADTDQGYESLLVAATKEDVEALNLGAQQVRKADGAIDTGGPSVRLQGAYRGHVGDVVLTRRNDYDLPTSTGDVVRNGQRWEITEIHRDGKIAARRLDEAGASVTLPAEYVRAHVQLGYASTGHSAQGATVDTCHVVAGIGQVDKAGVYVPMTRGRVHNHLYLMETQAGDPDTAHHHLSVEERRESTAYARELLIQAALRDRSDVSPHQVWRGARRDFELARLSSNQRVDVSPFEGTRMATVMADRQVRRRVRFEEFARNPNAVKKPVKEQTPSQIVRESLDTRPLADVSDELLGRMVSAPEQVRSEHAEAVATAEQLQDRAMRAVQADQQCSTLSQQVEQCRDVSQQSEQQLRDARREVAGEENRPMVSRWMRGGNLRAAKEHLDRATTQAEQDRGQLDQVQQRLDEVLEAQRLRPSSEQLSAASTQAEHLNNLVAALDQPEVVQAEATWREQSSDEVIRVDRNRRQHNAIDTSLIERIGAGGDPWDEDWLARSLSSSSVGTAVDAGQQQPPALGHDLDGGMELS
ncbi:MobF family relaxase [Corynebacterium sp. A21]|uniref:MobF family relaxase n=1 Tax=Corynebacterium sp. A21 TaxID=3457318 RepID=UPI003FD29A92